MKRAMIAAMALCLVAGCDKSVEGSSKDKGQALGSASAGAQAAKPPEGPRPGQRFAGTYRSTWGDTVFTQDLEEVNATYPGGTLACKAKLTELHCTWKEGEASGHAHLTQQPDGKLEGTWGNGENYTGGGEWTFTPKR